jgi:uncharacterized BrkB/YihY/UPF0761 family membrane protein
MNYNTLSVIGGAIILFAIAFVATLILTFIYAAFAKNSHKLKAPKMFLCAAVAALSWELVTYLSVMFISSYGKVVYGIVAGMLIAGVLYFVSHKFLEFETRDRITYSFLLAIIMNPAWLIVLGLI